MTGQEILTLQALIMVGGIVAIMSLVWVIDKTDKK